MDYKFGLIVFDDADLLDITGPKEVLSAVRIPIESDVTDPLLRLYETKALVKVNVVSVSKQYFITTADGTKIIPDLSYNDIKDISTYTGWIIPGGKGAQAIRENKRFIEWLRQALDISRKSLSVCTGAYLCAETGLFFGKKLTTHQRHHDIFQKEFPTINLEKNVRFVNLPTIIFASGVSAGIDGALHLVSELFDLTEAKKVAKTLNYKWREES